MTAMLNLMITCLLGLLLAFGVAAGLGGCGTSVGNGFTLPSQVSVDAE